MLKAEIISRPPHVDRVDRIKQALGREVLPEDHRFWILGEPLVVRVGDETITIPRGFTTDGASVPDWAARITSWDRWEDPQRWAGIVHDYMYGIAGVTKSHADNAFRAVLAAEGAGWFKRKMMFAAVVLGGGPAYKKSQRTGPNIFDDEQE